MSIQISSDFELFKLLELIIYLYVIKKSRTTFDAGNAHVWNGKIK